MILYNLISWKKKGRKCLLHVGTYCPEYLQALHVTYTHIGCQLMVLCILGVIRWQYRTALNHTEKDCSLGARSRKVTVLYAHKYTSLPLPAPKESSPATGPKKICIRERERVGSGRFMISSMSSGHQELAQTRPY